MNFVWEIAIKLASQPEERQRLFFKQAKEYSSYYEQAFLCINEKEFRDKVIELNGLYRFDNIFGELLGPHFKGCEEIRKYLFDSVIHFLVEVDLYHGLCKREYYSRKIRDDILKGAYGSHMAEAYALCTNEVQQIISDHLLIQYKTGSSLFLFTKVMKAVYQESITYQSTVDEKQILVYIGVKQENEQEKVVSLIVENFLPLSFHARLFWQYHFGILDVDATLKLDEIEII